eukprot:2719466-Ditylum_brightwellii.AAC.1
MEISADAVLLNVCCRRPNKREARWIELRKMRSLLLLVDDIVDENALVVTMKSNSSSGLGSFSADMIVGGTAVPK